MAIQNRRGAYGDFDPAKMKPGEWAVVQSGDTSADDGQAVYIAFEASKVKRMATLDELHDYDEQAQSALTEVQGMAENIQSAANTAREQAQSASASANAATQAKEDAQKLITDSEDTIKDYADTEIERAKTEIDEAYNSRIDAINLKADQIVALKSNAEEIANQAYSKATDAENEAADTGSKLDELIAKTNNLQLAVDSAVYGGLVDVSGYLVMVDRNGDIIGRYGPFAGSGGGGGGGSQVNADFDAKNTSGWVSTTISDSASCPVKISWYSVENEMSTGKGTLRISVNQITKATLEVDQGEITVDIAPYLNSGTNSVKLQIVDIYEQTKTFVISVQVVSLSISSTFDTSSAFSGAIQFPFTPVGAVSKTIYFVLDGTTIGTQTTSVSNRQLTYTIPAQRHGAHTFKCYFEAEVNGVNVKSNELYYEFIAIEDLNDTVIIISPFNKTQVQQYDSVVIPYTVYDPVNATAEVKLYNGDNLLSTQTVDRSEQSYTFRANEVGIVNFKIVSGTTTKTITFTVNETDIDVEAETENLVLYLSAQGRSNNEENPGTWSYKNISATFTNFNFVSDGWQTDNEGIDILRVSGDARLTIPYQMFKTDFRTSGKTISLEFATRNVLNYDSNIITCTSGGRGLTVTAQNAILNSEQTSLGTQYKENEHIRLDFVVTKRSEYRLILIYINGIMCGAVQYPDDDDFSQATPVNISIGSNDCTTDLYCIRVYDNNLTKQQVINNWIADTQDGATMLQRYNHNNIYDEYGNIVISQLPNDLPYLVIECDELPQFKGDKKTCTGYYTDPVHPSKSFTFTNAQIDIQGTSSQGYPRKNYKVKFRNGFTTSSGTIAKYAINNDAIPTSTFCFKKDYASSEGANNVELARAYNDICPYKTPAQVANNKVRQCIDGFPIVIFWHDTANDTVEFVGKYNFNNDKSTEEVFGFASPDESWEIKNNTGNRVIWKSDDYTGTAWLNDFEARYPDTDPAYTDATQLQEFATWAKSTDATAATGNTLPTPVTYTVTTTETVKKTDPDTGAITYEEVEVTKDITFTTDTAQYRLAKFKDEAGNYMEMQSALFYYLFTELFLMVDSRAKNAFPSFIGSEVTNG